MGANKKVSGGQTIHVGSKKGDKDALNASNKDMKFEEIREKLWVS